MQKGLEMVIAYTVTCEFEDDDVAEDWIAWLRDVHIVDVCRAGALDAELIALDPPARSCEVRYHFASREEYSRYEREDAPRLRAEGLARVPREGSVRFRRSVGTIRGRAGRFEAE